MRAGMEGAVEGGGRGAGALHVRRAVRRGGLPRREAPGAGAEGGGGALGAEELHAGAVGAGAPGAAVDADEGGCARPWVGGVEGQRPVPAFSGDAEEPVVVGDDHAGPDARPAADAGGAAGGQAGAEHPRPAGGHVRVDPAPAGFAAAVQGGAGSGAGACGLVRAPRAVAPGVVVSLVGPEGEAG